MDPSLLEHMWIDRNYFPRQLSIRELLQERSGYVPSVDRIANRLCSSINRERLKIQGEQTIKFKGLWIGDGCYVHIQPSKSDDGIGGMAVLRDATVDTENRKIYNVPIEVYVNADLTVDDRDFKTTLHHELTHMYDYLQRSIRALDLQKGPKTSSKQRKLDKIMDSSVKMDTLDRLDQEIGKLEGYQRKLLIYLRGCLYMITPMEQNAFIAQMRSELQRKAGELRNYRKAAEIVEHTQAWKNLKAVKMYLMHIQGLQKEKNQDTVVRWCNAFFGNTKTFNKSVRRLEYELGQFERKIKSRLGKMCGELYQNSEEFLKECKLSWNLKRPSFVDYGTFVEE